MKIKELRERRNEIVNSLKVMTEAEDKFNLEDFKAKENNLKDIENKISAIQKVEKLVVEKVEDKMDRVDFKNRLMNGETIKMANEHTTQNTQELEQTTYATSLERKLIEENQLFANARRITLEGEHTVPVQANKLGKFVKMAELEKYANQKATFGAVDLKAIKYGTLVTFSKEALEDAAYDLEGEIMQQLTEGLDTTLEGVILHGTEGTGGLMNIDKATEVSASLSVDSLIDLYYSMKKAYRKDAVFVIDEKVAPQLAKLKNQDGTPVLVTTYKDGVEIQTIFGRPLIFTDALNEGETDLAGKKVIALANMQKAILVGLRQNMEIEKSTEFGFLNDSVAAKASIRLDVQGLKDENAVAYLKLA